MTDRRAFLQSSLMAGLMAVVTPDAVGAAGPYGMQPRKAAVRPPRLRAGDTVGLMIPSGTNWEPTDLDVVVESLAALGLKTKLGKHVQDRYGYLAGRDEDRAADFNALFADPDVRAIHCIRGGWGAARMLPLVDFEQVAKTPKAVIGFSDITALLLALHAQTGLITFHGPNGASEWNETNVAWMRRVLWDGEAATFANPTDTGGLLAPARHRVRTITPGTARGRLIGGNLTVLTTLIGSRYIPDLTGAILFLEDVDEAPYRIDRMLTQMKLAGMLDGLAGFVWGTCSRCSPGVGFGSLTIPELLDHHIGRLGIPAYQGAMFGHINAQFTLPVGAEVELDSRAGTVRMLASAVG